MNPDQLQALYHDNEKCAQLVGLHYVSDELPGATRKKAGTGFSYQNSRGQTITEDELRQHYESLSVPPAWQSVWFAEDRKSHILATGIDDKNRKQYIYHPLWRKIRELINFYRLLSFGKQLPAVRTTVNELLAREQIDREQLLALMVWFLDHSYIRIGNEMYYEANESIGLTSLRKKNITLQNDTIILAFKGKSHKEQYIELRDPAVTQLVAKLLRHPGEKLFQTKGVPVLSPNDCNAFLQDITTEQISAKDFRTWGGTLAAFSHLKKHRAGSDNPEQVVIQAVDQAAEALGNTRSVARDHYVHPHILAAYSGETFLKLFNQVKPKQIRGLQLAEAELLAFLERLFKTEFDILAVKQDGASVA
ncbi:DNA topoisomerase IB [Candidatus Saccharibacteria bacterium]|nr:DNA topoisomerase IB [Candidatus Saccharibacteria bacterium]